MTYFELVKKYFNAWIATGNIDDSYADTDNIRDWLMNRELWTKEDELFLSSMTMEEVKIFADDIADKVKDYILSDTF